MKWTNKESVAEIEVVFWRKEGNMEDYAILEQFRDQNAGISTEECRQDEQNVSVSDNEEIQAWDCLDLTRAVPQPAIEILDDPEVEVVHLSASELHPEPEIPKFNLNGGPLVVHRPPLLQIPDHYKSPYKIDPRWKFVDAFPFQQPPEDRIATERGDLQIYGGQMKYYPETKSFNLWPVFEPENIDQRRTAIGLDSIAIFLKNRFDFDWDLEEQISRTEEFKREQSKLRQ